MDSWRPGKEAWTGRRREKRYSRGDIISGKGRKPINKAI